MNETSLIRSEVKKFISSNQNGLDIGSNGTPLFENSISLDKSFGEKIQLRGNALNLYWFKDCCLDYVYSSHCLEDFSNENKIIALKEWNRVIKPGGFLILYLPDQIRYINYCKQTGQYINPDHVDPIFSLEILRKLVNENCPYLKEVYCIPEHANYSFFVVYQYIKQIVVNISRNGAIGDILITSTIIDGLKKKYPNCIIHYYTKYPEAVNLIKGIDNIIDASQWNNRIHGIDCLLTMYPITDGYPNFPMKRHLIEYVADNAGVCPGEYSLKLLFQNLVKDKFITFHIKTGWSIYKEWNIENWHNVIKKIKPLLNGIQIVQIGTNKDPLIEGIDIDLRGKTTLEETCALVKDSILHVGCDSFTNHLAGGLKKKAVILFGSTSPIGSGYPTAINIWKNLKCSPCYKENPDISKETQGICLHKSCMKQISIEEVKNAILKQLEK